MGELIHTPSTEQEADFEEPEPPSSRVTLIRITALLKEAWDKYRTPGVDKTAAIHDLYIYTAELREAFNEYSSMGGTEDDLPTDVQTELMCIRQPVLPPRGIASPEITMANTPRTVTRTQQSRRMGVDAVSRMATLRNGY